MGAIAIRPGSSQWTIYLIQTQYNEVVCEIATLDSHQCGPFNGQIVRMTKERPEDANDNDENELFEAKHFVVLRQVHMEVV